MPWLLIALAAPLLYAISNILDSYLTNRLFKNVWSFPFYIAMFNIPFVFLALLVETPHMPPLRLLAPLLGISLIELLYLVPYYKALQHDDTSIVSSLFELGRVIVPILAYIFVREKMQPLQYVGFAIVTFASVALTYNPRKKIRFNASLGYMFIASLMLSIEAILYKFAFNETDWATGFIIPTLITTCLAVILLIVPYVRRHVVLQAQHFTRHNFMIFTGTALFTYGGMMASTYAIALRPVIYERAVEGIQPLFVLILALLFRKTYPRIFREHIDGRTIARKLILFTTIIIGVVLVVK